MSIIKKLAGRFVRTKQPAPKQVFDFDYRITRKKHANGKEYYVGEGVKDGALCVLTECRYTKESYQRSLCYPYRNERPRYVPKYLLDNFALRTMYAGHGAGVNSEAKLDDPVKMKEIICEIIKTEANKEANLAYSKSVSQGRCKCL